MSLKVSMELDHVFVLVTPDGPDLAYLKSLGLTETYRRRHAGQGTENICFCFDNIFLECLWITSAGEARSDPIARTGLYERSQYRTRATSPFGIAWRDSASSQPRDSASNQPRDSASNQPIDIATWPFKPPYLPPGMSIDVAIESDDFHQPMMFKSPGSTPPSMWPPEKRGLLQEPAGLGKVISVILNWPRNAPPSPGLVALAANTFVDLAPAKDNTPSISLIVEQRASSYPLKSHFQGHLVDRCRLTKSQASVSRWRR